MKRLFPLLALAALPLPAAGQTQIVPDSGNALATGTTAATLGPVTTIDGGTRAGNNLFHSFARFSLAQGDQARWVSADPLTVRTIVNRVTGGTPSTIGGMIDSRALPNAAFYFINPAGIVFTEGAQVNVPNAAYFTTANALRFADGASFLAATANGSTFSIANPTGFGFLGQGADVLVRGEGAIFADPEPGERQRGSTLRFNRLGLVGANVRIENSSVQGGVLDLFAVGSGPGNIGIGSPLNAGGLTGAVIFAASDVSLPASPFSGDGVRINAGIFDSSNSDFITEANGNGTGDIRIKAKDIRFSGSLLSTTTDNAADSGSIFMQADTVLLTDSTWARTNTKPGITGRSGQVAISARDVLIDQRSFLTSSTRSSGMGGGIDIRADVVTLDSGVLGADALPEATGPGGAISIDARTVRLINGSSASSQAYAASDAGDVTITARESLLMQRSGISVTVSADDAGKAGNIHIDAPSLSMTDQSVVTSTARGGGTAGTVTVDAGDMLIADGSRLESEVEGRAAGQPGEVRIDATTLTVRGGTISASTLGAGQGGLISIDADTLVLDGANSVIRSDALSTGDAGDIMITAGQLKITGGQGTLITSQTTVPPGETTIGAVERITGDAGNIQISLNRLDMAGGEITSSTSSFGDAGNVLIFGGAAYLSNGAAITSAAERVHFTNRAGNAVSRPAQGRAGGVGFFGTVFDARGGALLSTSTFGNGPAGNIGLYAGRIAIDEGARLTSTAAANTMGHSGLIQLAAIDLSISGGAMLQTGSGNPQPAGGISLTALDTIMIGGAGTRIASENVSAEGGEAGGIALFAPDISLTGGALVTTNSNAGAAGAITFGLERDGFLKVSGQSTITTSSGPGTGGIILISNPYAVIADGASILALGQQGGANVQITADYFIRSADQQNRVSVAGDLVVQSQVGDVSGGTEAPDIAFIDASGVLAGQCGAARASGEVSQIAIAAIGTTATKETTSCR